MSKVREIRKERNLTSEQMAMKLGITIGTYSKKENGHLRFSLKEARFIAKLFGMSIDDLFFANELSKTERQ